MDELKQFKSCKERCDGRLTLGLGAYRWSVGRRKEKGALTRTGRGPTSASLFEKMRAFTNRHILSL